MRDRRKRWPLQAGAFLLGFCLLFSLACGVLNDKGSRKFSGYFYDHEEEYEVLFFGSSLMMDDLYPLQLYRQAGILSYNLGMTKEYISVSYWKLRDALQRSSPKVAVVELTGATPEEKLLGDDNTLALLHNSLDAMPLSFLKVQALADLFGWRNIDEIGNYLFPISQFHIRWKALTEDDYRTYLLEDRGAMPNRELAYDETPLPAPAGGEIQPSEVGLAYLRRIAELCRQEGVQLLLVSFPTRTSAESRAVRSALAAAVTAEYDNAVYLDLFEEDLIDPAVDFADGNGHLNTSGAAKVTRWMGDYLQTHYSLTDRRGDAACAHWDASWEIAVSQHANSIAGQSDLATALMLLNFPGVEYRFCLTPAGLARAETPRLLQNLGAQGWQQALEEGRCFQWRSANCPEQDPGAETEKSWVEVYSASTGEFLARTEF